MADTISKLISAPTAYEDLEHFVSRINRQLSYNPIVLNAYKKRGINAAKNGNRNLMVVGIIPPPRIANYLSIKSTPANQITESSLSPVNARDPKYGFVQDPLALVKQLIKDPDFLDSMIGNASAPPSELAAVILASSGADPFAKISNAYQNFGTGVSDAGGIVQLSSDQMETVLGSSKAEKWKAALDSVDYVAQTKLSVEFFSESLKDSGAQASAANLYALASGTPPSSLGDPDYKLRSQKIGEKPVDRRFDSTYTARTDQKAPHSPADKLAAAQARGYDAVINLDGTGKGSITNRDLANRVEFIKGTEAYRVLVEAVNARILQANSEFNVSQTTGLSAEELKSIQTASIFGIDATYSDDIPTKSIGGLTEVNATRQVNVIQQQIVDVNTQIEAISNLWPVYFMVNPATFNRSYSTTTDVAKGRRSNIVSMWNEQPLSISASGTTPAQYFVDNNNAGGITNINRVYSASYQNLMHMVSIFKNNGIIYTGRTTMQGNGGVPVYALSCYIYYDGRVYVGSFDSFSISDSADKPYNLAYDFQFTCRYEIQTYNQGE